MSRRQATTCTSPESAPAPWAGHATFVTGLVVAQAPAAEIVVRQVLNSQTGRASVWDTAKAMVSFANANVDVLNLSFGCRTAVPTSGVAPLALRRAVEVLSRKTVLVAAAGNHGATDHRTLPTWPAALPGVVAVGATGNHDHPDAPTAAPFTPRMPWIDCPAPGFDVVSTFLHAVVDLGSPKTPQPVRFDGFARWSGSSFAAATVSGAIAAAMVAGELTAKGALHHLLTTDNPIVTKYDWMPS